MKWDRIILGIAIIAVCAFGFYLAITINGLKASNIQLAAEIQKTRIDVFLAKASLDTLKGLGKYGIDTIYVNHYVGGGIDTLIDTLSVPIEVSYVTVDTTLRYATPDSSFQMSIGFHGRFYYPGEYAGYNWLALSPVIQKYISPAVIQDAGTQRSPPRYSLGLTGLAGSASFAGAFIQRDRVRVAGLKRLDKSGWGIQASYTLFTF
jgi:hypothetical protein